MKSLLFILAFSASALLALSPVRATDAQAATSIPDGVRRLRASEVQLQSQYPVKRDIMTTYFWIGQGASGYNDTTNYKSAWDSDWTRNFGGTDAPETRAAFRNSPVPLPKKFAPTANPFYVALPFNDIRYPDLARQYVPWWNEKLFRQSRFQSQCKGRWVMIEYQGLACFAQWEDVGPLRYDHAAYVFGNARPTSEHSGAGLDVSPAVRDYLGLQGLDRTQWRFVEDREVPDGPWLKLAEQGILFSAFKNKGVAPKPAPPAPNDDLLPTQ